MPHLKKMYLSSNKELSAAAGLLAGGGGGIGNSRFEDSNPHVPTATKTNLAFSRLVKKKGEQSEGIKGTPTEPKRHLNSSLSLG